MDYYYVYRTYSCYCYLYRFGYKQCHCRMGESLTCISH